MPVNIVFVGDTADNAVEKMLKWLNGQGYKTKALTAENLPNDYIPVILDSTQNIYVVRTWWPNEMGRPSWCNGREVVLLFKERALKCCPLLVKQSVERLIKNYPNQ